MLENYIITTVTHLIFKNKKLIAKVVNMQLSTDGQ